MSEGREGATFVLIGHPVGHSLSPVIHEAAYQVLGVTGHRYVAVDCPDIRAVESQVDALRRGEISGANVTVPWKKVALEIADEAHDSARDVGAANVLTGVSTGSATKIVAHNTDVAALSNELSLHRPGAQSAVVIGNGGAALASVAACRALRIDDVTVTARKFRGERSSAWEGAASLESLGATVVPWPIEPNGDSSFRRAIRSCDVVIQSTSDGMRGATDGSSVRNIVPWADLAAETFAYDLVYNPAVTPFVAAARERGLKAESGLGMLVGQAAVAVELWLGRRPPAAELRAAAEAALARKFPV